MKKLLTLLLCACLGLAAQTSFAADRLDGFLTLAADDHAALAAVKATPERHVMMYFGDFKH